MATNQDGWDAVWVGGFDTHLVLRTLRRTLLKDKRGGRWRERWAHTGTWITCAWTPACSPRALARAPSRIASGRRRCGATPPLCFACGLALCCTIQFQSPNSLVTFAYAPMAHASWVAPWGWRHISGGVVLTPLQPAKRVQGDSQLLTAAVSGRLTQHFVGACGEALATYRP